MFFLLFYFLGGDGISKTVILTKEEKEMLAELLPAARAMLQEGNGEHSLYVKFRTRNSRRMPQFYMRRRGTECQEKEEYLSVDALAANLCLVRSYCAEKILKGSEQILQGGEKNFSGAVLFGLQDILEELFAIFGELTPKEFVPNRIRREHWAQRQKEPTYRREELIQPTRRGDKVRSKFEEAIANVLFEEGIPYRYEQKLEIDHKLFLPDFMLADPLTGKFTYLEAFGMMEKESYAIASMQKLEAYARAALYPGERLMIVFDSMPVPFDQEAFRQWVRLKFRLDERQRYRREKERRKRTARETSKRG